MKSLLVLALSSVATFSFAEPITPIESSGSTFSSFTASPFFVIGIYEPDNEHGWKIGDDGNYIHVRERGNGTVYIEEQSSDSVVIALGSYEPTDWAIKGPGADNVSEIILFGYHSATISGQTPDTIVSNKTYAADASDYIKSFYSWENNNRDSIVSELEAISGTSLTSFTGVYNAVSFHVDAH